VVRAAHEVLIVGGGPAGAAAATLLARWGHGVRLLAKTARRAPDLGESIPPSAHKLLDVLGVRAALDAAPFIRSSGNTVWWGSDTPRVESFAAARQGWQVTRTALAAMLLEHAQAAGADVRWVHGQSATTHAEDAAFVLDCTGRTGLLARARGLRIQDATFRTVAMVGLWVRERPFDLPDPSHTLIESYDGGWAWSVPKSRGERFVAVMVDPRRMSGPGSAGSGLKPGLALYREQVGRTRQMVRIIAGARLTADPSGWDASMYHARRYVDDRVLLVGDAASFLDPLSSAGIKKALASGWLAAVAVHTSLLRPAMRDVALTFFAAREAEVFASFRSMTKRYFSEAAAGHAHPFWRDREDEPAAAPDRSAVGAAFERLRSAPDFRVARHTGVRIEHRPAVRENEVVMEARLVTGVADAGTRYAFNVDLLALIELAPACPSVPDLFAAYNQHHAPVTWPDFLGALATAFARNWLVWL
jgi:flavin-dependent dehydrogenase